PAARPPVPPPEREATLERRQRRGEQDLLRELSVAPEIGLGDKGLAVFSSYVSHSDLFLKFEARPRQTEPTPILRVRPDLAGLPFQSGPSCKLHSTTAQNLDTLSRKLRVYLTRLTPVGPDGRRPNPAQLEDTLRREKRGKSPEWKRPEAVPTLVQLLMHEEPPLRRILVEMLA